MRIATVTSLLFHRRLLRGTMSVEEGVRGRPRTLGPSTPSPSFESRQLLQDGVSAANRQAGSGLDHQLLDLAVVDHHRIALRTVPHAETGGVEFQPDGLGELAVAV